jgi:hypothetical protein
VDTVVLESCAQFSPALRAYRFSSIERPTTRVTRVGRCRRFVGSPGSPSSGSVTQLSGEWHCASVGVRRPEPMPIPFIQYSGEDLLIAIGGCDESGFSAGRTRRLGMAI